MIQRIVLFGMLLLAACAPAGQRMTPSGVIEGGGMPVMPEHTLSPGDQFQIRLPFAAESNDTVTVGMDGTVAPKQIGSVAVGGLTIPEATERLKARYATLLKAPELSITMRRYQPEMIYVDGWVTRPGLIRSDVPLTLARALAQAGGVKSGAKTGDVLLMRKEPDGSLHTYTVALGSFAGAAGEDPVLKSFDVVYVPQTAIAAVTDFARQYYGNIPFSASFQAGPVAAPSIIAPRAFAPAPAPVVVPR